MSDQTTSKNTPNAISLPESAGGRLPWASPDGMMLDLLGQEVVPASHSVSPESKKRKAMNAISGLTGSGLLPLSALAWSLVNRLRERKTTLGRTAAISL